MVITYCLLFAAGFLVGYALTSRDCVKPPRATNVAIAKQNKLISGEQQQPDPSDYWKPVDWKADWEQGDA